MNKLAVVLGVAAVATLAGCKDPEYARNKPAAQDEVKSVETEPAESGEAVGGDQSVGAVAGETGADGDIVVSEDGKTCTCAPGVKHDKPCTCGASDCKCPVEASADGKAAATGAAAGAAAGVAAAEQVADADYSVYIVQRGDYLAKISKKYNIKIDAIKKLNNMTDDNLRLGQKIKLPGKVEVGAQEVPAGAIKATPKKVYESYNGPTKDYVVVSGDSLGKIAYSNGMNIRQLKELNGLTSDTIKIGQKLKIAAAAPKAAAPVAVKAAAPVAVKAEAPAKVAAPAKAAVKVETPAKAVEAPVEPVKDTVTAVEQPAAEVVDAVAEGMTNYVVQDGDDLPTIAIEFRVPVARLRELNNLGEGDEVKPGQTLKIPAEQ